MEGIAMPFRKKQRWWIYMAKKKCLLATLTLFMILIFGIGTGSAEDRITKCAMKFNLSGWSIFYETMSGTGTIICDNGQSSKVKISVKGGGLTAGVSKLHGKGEFSAVYNIRELYGSYARGGAHAGAGGSATGQVVTKGKISLALSATGTGVDLGISVGNFRIKPIGSAKNK
jgi:hypothetical protein